MTSKQMNTNRPKKKKNIASQVKNKKATVSKKRPQNKKNMKKRRKINRKRNKWITALFDLLFFLLIIFMLGGAALFKISDEKDKSFFGYRFHEVLTNSMRKTKKEQTGNFIAGDVVIVKLKEPEEVKVGEIVTFLPNKKTPDVFLTHRVIEIKEKDAKVDSDSIAIQTEDNYPIFVTQGDANNAPDPAFSGDKIVGTVILAIPKAGKIIRFIRENLMPLLVFIVCFFLLIIVIRQYFAEEPKTKDMRRKKKRSTTRL